MREESIFIACAADENFAEPLLVMLTSLQMHTQAKCKVFLLDGGLSEKRKKFIEKHFLKDNFSVEILEVDASSLPSNLKISKDIPISSYYRLLLPELLAKEVERVIYLDCDLIVEGDIEDLWEIPLGEAALLAVAEMSAIAHLVSSPKGLLSYKLLGIPASNKYFNAGVLVINLEKWRREGLAKKVFAYLEDYSDYVLWHDQDGLNALLWEDWEELPAQWNLMTAFFLEESMYADLKKELPYEHILNDIKILHYTNSKDKPWKETCRHPLKGRYSYYQKEVREILKKEGFYS